MSQNVIATCQDCAKKYRVPSPDRSYQCKACGGTATAESTATESATASPARSRVRREPKKASKLPLFLGVAAGAIAVGGGLWMGLGSGEVSAAGERDLAKVAEHFDNAWGKGDLSGILAMTHPNKVGDIELTLAGASTHRGWTDGFSPVKATEVPTAGLNPGDMAKATQDGTIVETGISMHEIADGQVIGSWQFSEAKDRWMLYALEIPPPLLAPRLKDFEAAWASGDVTKIRDFLRQEKKDKLIAALAKVADRDGWEEQYPALKPAGTEPRNLDKLSTPGFSLAYPTKAKALYDTKYGRMSTSWRLDRVSDDWFLRSFAPPK